MYVRPSTGELAPSVSSITAYLGGSADPLIGWAARITAEAAVDTVQRWVREPDSVAVNAIKSESAKRRKQAADLGTRIHAHLAAIMLGTERPEVREDEEGHLAALDEWLAEAKPEPIAAEVSVWGGTYAGTPDLVARVWGNAAPVLVDLKTGSSATRPAYRAQMVAYARAGLLIHDDGREDSMPRCSSAFILHVTPGKWREVEVDLWGDKGEADAHAFTAARALWGWAN
jgi:hypothetical protein